MEREVMWCGCGVPRQYSYALNKTCSQSTPSSESSRPRGCQERRRLSRPGMRASRRSKAGRFRQERRDDERLRRSYVLWWDG